MDWDAKQFGSVPWYHLICQWRAAKPTWCIPAVITGFPADGDWIYCVHGRHQSTDPDVADAGKSFSAELLDYRVQSSNQLSWLLGARRSVHRTKPHPRCNDRSIGGVVAGAVSSDWSW